MIKDLIIFYFSDNVSVYQHGTICMEGIPMRPLWKDILAAVWIGMIIPGIVLNAFVLKQKQKDIQIVSLSREIIKPVTSVTVRDPDGICTKMPLNDYLIGVLLAEVPASFHPEALKAQSVAARTYVWKAFTTGGKHTDGSVCTDSVCCQAYIPESTYLSKGGTQEMLGKIRQSVLETDPMVLSYQGELIEATYFSSSGGKTESAFAVWGADYPYLQSVFSPEEDLKETIVAYTISEFQQLLDLSFPDDMDQWIGRVTFTEGGGVESMEICGEVYTGVQLRSILGLRSTAFQIHKEGTQILVTTRGYGHRVGLSQYGANAMAEAGSTWQQILQHYYPGTTLHPIKEF